MVKVLSKHRWPDGGWRLESACPLTDILIGVYLCGVQLIEVYKCLCDETRLRILHLLSHRPLCVCHFQDILSAPQVKVSKHLAYLREHGLVETQREGSWIVYSLPGKPSLELARTNGQAGV